MNKFFRNISIFTLVLIMGCSKKSPAVTVNIYDSEEYKSLDRKDLMVGESIWSTACFRCHMYGTNGAVLLDDKAYWDKAASKGIDELYKSVWEGKKVENGQMPAKGFCNLCSEDEIRKSVFYIFNLGKRVQESNEEKALKNDYEMSGYWDLGVLKFNLHSNGTGTVKSKVFGIDQTSPIKWRISDDVILWEQTDGKGSGTSELYIRDGGKRLSLLP